MTTNDTDALTLADIDQVLPPEYDILLPGDPRNDNRAALRAVRHNLAPKSTTSPVQGSPSNSRRPSPRASRLLAEESGTRFVQLLSAYDTDPFFHASVTHTIAALFPFQRNPAPHEKR